MGPNQRRIAREERAAREQEARAKRADDQAARHDATAVIEAWNARLTAGHPAWFAPTIGAALVAGYPLLSVYCPGCRTEADIDLRTIDRHPDAAVTTLLLSLRCRLCGGGPMPRLTRLWRGA